MAPIPTSELHALQCYPVDTGVDNLNDTILIANYIDCFNPKDCNKVYFQQPTSVVKFGLD